MIMHLHSLSMLSKNAAKACFDTDCSATYLLKFFGVKQPH